MNQRCWFDPEPSFSGKFSIKSRHNIERLNSVVDQGPFENENWLKEKAIQVLQKEMKLPESKTLGYLETIEQFDTPNSLSIGLVNDQWLGIMIESADKDFLQRVFDRLEEIANSEDQNQTT